GVGVSVGVLVIVGVSVGVGVTVGVAVSVFVGVLVGVWVVVPVAVMVGVRVGVLVRVGVGGLVSVGGRVGGLVGSLAAGARPGAIMLRRTVQRPKAAIATLRSTGPRVTIAPRCCRSTEVTGRPLTPSRPYRLEMTVAADPVSSPAEALIVVV